MPFEPAFVASATGELTLLASRDKATGLGVFPRLPATSPAASRYEDLDLQGQASLYSYTVIHPNPKSGLTPFVLAMVDYPQKVRVVGRLDCAPKDVTIGMKLDCRQSGELASGFVFGPAGETHDA